MVITFILQCIYLVLFFIAVIFTFSFGSKKEGKDERGQKIVNTSYSIAFQVLLIGWLIIEVINDFIIPLSYQQYQTAIFLLLSGTIIVQALILFFQNLRS